MESEDKQKFIRLTEIEIRLINHFRNLSEEGKLTLIKTSEEYISNSDEENKSE